MADPSPPKELPKLFAKILVVGDSGAGKTCIVNRYSKGSYRVDTKATVGTDFTLKTIEVDKRSVTLQIWDTAGQERYRTMTTVFYRGAQAGVIVFDLTNRQSFVNLTSWLNTMKTEISDNSNARIPFVIVGNKVDVEEREVKRDEAEKFCKSNGDLPYFETSARSNVNLDETFEEVAREVIKSENEMSQVTSSSQGRQVTLVDTPSQPSKCSC
jgi:Ras-related protein Rab-7A